MHKKTILIFSERYFRRGKKVKVKNLSFPKKAKER